MVVAGLAATSIPAASGAPTAPTPVNTAAPALTGTPTPGQTLTCSTGAWSGNPSGFAYVWLRDGSPIAGQAASTYVVQPADQGHSISCRVTATNVGGEYTIVGLPSGSYKVSFSPAAESVAGYLLQYFNNQSSWSTANLVSVTAPNATGGVNAAMHLGGAIGGTVTAAVGGQPLAGIAVCAALGEAFGGCTTTNSAGEYSIVGLTSGTYTVSFVNNSFFGEGGDYVSQSQGGVVVTAPNKTANVNAQLQPGGHITGTVTHSSAPVQGVVVCAFGESFSCSVTDASGKYTLVGLNGSYRVVFIPGSEASFGASSNGNYILQYYNGSSSVTEAEAVSVTAPDVVPNINAELQTGGQISGVIKDAVSHAQVEHVEVCAFGGKGSGGCASSSATGEYTISGLSTGSYTVEFLPPESSGYAPQSHGGIAVAAPSKTENVNAEMQAGGHIVGTVTDASTHAPLANVRVCAGNHEVGKCTSTDSAGAYNVSGLSTSPSYTVSFVPPEGANYIPQSLTGIAVTVSNTTSNVDAAMQSGAQIVGRATDSSSGSGLANITVCASEVGEGIGGGCATTNGPGGSASANSNAVAVPAPNSAFKLAKKPKFNPKTNNLEFVFVVANAGTFKWGLFFKNSDVGFADSLGISLGEEGAIAETAKKKGKARRCKAGFVKRKNRCVRPKVPFASGSKSVPAGTVTILVHAGAKAIEALKAGRTLHVSGPFAFQSALGGAPVTHTESAVVRLPEKKGKHRKK